MNSLQLMAQEENADIIAITEHWKCRDELQMCKMVSYKLVSSYCRSKGSHGGSAIYSREELNCTERLDYNLLSISNVIECSAAQISLENHKILIVCIYRPNSQPLADVDQFLEKLRTILERCTLEKAELILVGDFNLDILSSSPDVQEFISLLESFNLKFKNFQPTRPVSGTCLDNIITPLAGQTSVIEYHISDHSALKFTTAFNHKQKDRTVKRRIINDESTKLFLEELSLLKWDDIFTNQVDPGQLWNIFHERFSRTFEQCFPKVNINVSSARRNFKLTPELINIKKQLDLLYIISFSRPEFNATYKSTKKQYDLLLSRTKKDYFNSFIRNSDNKSKASWRVINSLTTGKMSSAVSGSHDNSSLMPDDFNNFFIDYPSILTEGLSKSPSEERDRLGNSFYMFDVSHEEVLKTVKSLKSKQSCGYDEIPMKVLKLSIEVILSPLCFIINRSFREGIFPDLLKIAIVKPLYKKGPVEHPNSYRPISILSSFSKIFEKILSNRLLNFFHKFNVISIHQHGFVKNRNIETAIYELINEVLVTMEQGEVPMGLFLDLSKAFDCVEHGRLLEILEDCGIRDNQLKLMESYLSSRKQMVAMEVDGEVLTSEEREVTMGVPQGSIPGPILFIVYINRLPKAKVSARHSMGMFADDTNYRLKSSNISTAIEDSNNVLKSVGDWFRNHNLILNIDKTQCMFFYSERSKLHHPLSINISGNNLMVKDSIVFLGIVIDKHLKWGPHIEQLRGRLNSVCYMLFMLRNQVDFDLLKLVYFSNFQSILSYGIIFWGNASHVCDLFVIQKRALRTILNLGYRQSCRGFFRSNNILTISGLYIYRLLIFFSKQNHYFESFKNLNNTRRMFPFYVPVHKTTLREKSVECMAVNLFNILPSQIRNLSCHIKFRKALYVLILSCEPYNIDEFKQFCKI